MNNFHPSADIKSKTVGVGMHIWQFVVVIGARVTFNSGVQLWDGLRIADDVLSAPTSPLPTTGFRAANNTLSTMKGPLL